MVLSDRQTVGRKIDERDLLLEAQDSVRDAGYANLSEPKQSKEEMEERLIQVETRAT